MKKLIEQIRSLPLPHRIITYFYTIIYIVNMFLGIEDWVGSPHDGFLSQLVKIRWVFSDPFSELLVFNIFYLLFWLFFPAKDKISRKLAGISLYCLVGVALILFSFTT